MAKKIQFNDLTYDKFRELAMSDELSHHEKVGFPNEYREGKEEAIFLDVRNKLQALNGSAMTVLEIGPGCSRLPVMLADLCRQKNSKLLFVDSEEMLALLADANHVEKWPGRYPAIPQLLEDYANRVNAILAYSVIQYVFAEGNLWDFIDRSLALLADGGEMLLGDIPNVSMRKRFFASAAGVRCHQEFTGNNELPQVTFNQLEPGQMDDSVVFAILARARAQGFHAWVVPQGLDLPMANRREDILIRKP